MTEQKDRVLKKLATSYLRGNRPKDAIPIYSHFVDASKQDCESESTAVSTCASTQHSLGIAKMHAGDFDGALASLRDAETNYAKAEKFSDFHESTMIDIKNQAQTKLLIAVALFRLGKTSDAITTAEAAIPQLTRVQADQTIQVAIRDDAARSLQEAQVLLTRFKSTQ